MPKLNISHLAILEDMINELLEKNWPTIQHSPQPPEIALMFNLDDEFEFGVGFVEKDLLN